eukprot:4448710-Amphidinium_carterae.2
MPPNLTNCSKGRCVVTTLNTNELIEGSNDSQVKSSPFELDSTSVKQSFDREAISSNYPKATALLLLRVPPSTSFPAGASVSQSSSSKNGVCNSLSDNAESVG